MVLAIENDYVPLRQRISVSDSEQRWSRGQDRDRGRRSRRPNATARDRDTKPARKAKPTAEELDAELDAYMGSSNQDTGYQSEPLQAEAESTPAPGVESSLTANY